MKFIRSSALLLALSAIICRVTPAAAVDITTGLVGHWTFDETSGTTAVDVASGNNGVLVNWNPFEPKWVPGALGGALEFDNTPDTGNDNYVLTNTSISYSQYTISFYLKTHVDTHNLNPRLVSPQNGYEGWVLLNHQYNKGVGFYYQNGVTNAQDPNPPKPETWEHYAIVYDVASGGTLIYRNGIFVGQGTTAAGARVVPTTQWVFGHSQDLTNNNVDSLDGEMDDIRIYNRFLSADDIMALNQLRYFTGDFDFDNHATTADVPAMLNVLTNVNAYKTKYELSDSDLLKIGDVNGDGKFNNADVQSLLNLLKSGGSGSVAAVPEPSTIALAFSAIIFLSACRSKRKVFGGCFPRT